MKKSIHRYSVWLIVLMVGFSSLLDAQADLVSSNQLELVSEEISLFSDRELYIAGETMWFSLAIKYRQTGSLSIASKVAYVDLVGSTGVVMTRVKICLLYTSPSPRDQRGSRMPSSA